MKILSIIVTYNATRNEWLRKCLNSLRASTQATDILLVDNASTDSTVAIIKAEYPEVELVASKENLGFSKANNIGFSKAQKESYDFVFLLNQDAWVEPDTIAKLLNAHYLSPEYGILSPIHFNGEGDNLDKLFSKYMVRSNDEGRKMYFDYLVHSKTQVVYQIDFVNAACWLVSKACFSKVGMFDDTLFQHYGEDSNYVNRVRFHGFRLGIVPDSYVCHDRETRGDIQKSKIFKNELLEFTKGGSDIGNKQNIQFMNAEIKKQQNRLINTFFKLKLREARLVFLLIQKMKKRKKLITRQLLTY